MDKAAYIREWRRTPEGKASLEAQKRRERAKRAAVADLIARHGMEYLVLLNSHAARIESEERQ